LPSILESGTLRHCIVAKGSAGVDEMNECAFRMGQTWSEQILTVGVFCWVLQWLKMAWKWHGLLTAVGYWLLLVTESRPTEFRFSYTVTGHVGPCCVIGWFNSKQHASIQPGLNALFF